MQTKNLNRICRVAAVALAAAAIVVSPVTAKPTAERKYPAFDRKHGEVKVKASSTRLPERLRPQPAEKPVATQRGHGTVRSTSVPRTRPGTSGGRVDRVVAVDEEARAAARWAVAELLQRKGRRQLYRAGLFDGMRDVLNGPGPDGFARAEGYSLGLTSAEARHEGRRFGEGEALRRAEGAAIDRVEAGFRNLDREPRFDPRPDTVRLVPPSLELESPRLRDLLTEFPLDDFADRRFLNGWGFDGRRLAGCRSYDEFYDSAWDTPAGAFDLWNSDPHRAAPYLVLGTSVAAERFETVFLVEYSARLNEFFERHGSRVYGRGFDDGWSYAMFVREEQEFRQAFDKGFEAAFEKAAVRTFERRYARDFRIAYERAFDDWSDNAKPEIAFVELIDADRDGVFEPGEEVDAYYELVNYGGAGGDVALRLDGDVLAVPATDDVRLPARAVLRGDRPITAPISELIRPRTRTQLSFAMSGQTTELPLRVSYPLEIDRRSIRVLRNDLAGQVQIGINVSNESLKPVDAQLRLAVPALAGYVEGQTLGVLQAETESMASFLVQGLDPLALMAGDIVLELEAVSGARSEDRLVHKLGDTVRNVENRDLLQYMLQLSQDSDASDERIAQARELMLIRLREDWKVAVIRNGNPYKRDFKRGEARTALGDLVQSYRAEQNRMQRHDVFDGMGDEIQVLTASWPGIHPFLRKYARRLAARLP